LLALGPADGQLRFGDVNAIVQLQRAADTYAFLHRQVERRIGRPHSAAPDSGAMAAAMREARSGAAPGEFFSPAAAAALRDILAAAGRAPGCDAGDLRGSGGSVQVNGPATATRRLPGCLADALPHLPAELEFRSAGSTLVLVDGHANLIVDVLPAVLTGSDTP
jgi:hypothetical protein